MPVVLSVQATLKASRMQRLSIVMFHNFSAAMWWALNTSKINNFSLKLDCIRYHLKERDFSTICIDKKWLHVLWFYGIGILICKLSFVPHAKHTYKQLAIKIDCRAIDYGQKTSRQTHNIGENLQKAIIMRIVFHCIVNSMLKGIYRMCRVCVLAAAWKKNPKKTVYELYVERELYFQFNILWCCCRRLCCSLYVFVPFKKSFECLR